MQFSATFSALSLSILAALTVVVAASPAALSSEVTKREAELARSADDDGEVAAYVISEAQLKYWLATTDADLTFIGAPINALSPRSALDTTVTYCNRRIDNLCGGTCTVYTGGATCLSAPNTQCLSATNNVGFCDRSACGGSCNQFSSCGTRLDNNFCSTPGTASILVGSA